jgi:metal-sulfur cluster biosynthetic enzyme
MRLVEDLDVDEEFGRVTYRFRPSSPLCPLAHSLAVDIKHAVASVDGIEEQEIEVVGYVRSEELTEIINRSDV